MNTNEDEKSLVEQQLQLTCETMKGMDAQMKLVIDALQAKAAQLQRERARPRARRRAKALAPIATLLHGFAQQLAAKVNAITELLTPDQRDRLRAIAPGFVRAALANEADVVQLVKILFGVSSEAAAFCITFYLPLLEQRFSS